MKKKKKGILPVILSIAGPAIAGILQKKNRDAETPKAAGRLRDAGAIIGGIGATSAIATNAGSIDWDQAGLTPTQVVWMNIIMCVVGGVLYLTGIGTTAPENEEKE